MNFKEAWDKIKPFAGMASALIPGGPAVLAAVNQFLPEDEKLPETATGAQIGSAIERLPPESQVQLMSKQIDVEIKELDAQSANYMAMVQADSHSTRPKIALMMAWTMVLLIAGSLGIIGMGVYNDGLKGVDLALVAIGGAFTMMSAVPARVLLRYFGELRIEQGQRLGMPAPEEKKTSLF